MAQNALAERQWSVGQLTQMYVSSVLGAGILVVPGISVQEAGWAAPLVWVVLAGICVCIAQMFARISMEFPRVSGITDVIGSGMGSANAAIAQGLLLVVYAVGNPAMAIATAHYLEALTDRLPPVPVTAMALMLLSLALAGLSDRAIARIQDVSIKIALVALGVSIVLAVPGMDLANLGRQGSTSVAGVLTAAGVAFYAYLGWENVSLLGGSVRDPRHTFPRAIRRAVPLVALTYLAATVAYAALPPGGPTALVPALTAGLPAPLRLVLLASSAVAIIAATNAWVLGATRLYVHAVRGRTSESRAKIVLACAYAGTLALFGAGIVTHSDLLAWTSALFMSVYALCSAALARLQRRWSVQAVVVLLSSLVILGSRGIAGLLFVCVLVVVVLATGKVRK
ncbi:amino acid permease [Actinoplanes lobatus]|uniref:Amino acid efflux transporter n=1 Tax=Actinoplanes lobatus TaxID=113568 RepID=A0A7W7MFT2_9ACTN|nr:APC family permease [Actinoplanes lobatus]MBB4748682.1 amino acid efflux transporter [Actinoplanes lobatus]GGN58394.1 amino acid permease [Actinoplanes lobatus]GIE37416.1 amino acid permease [Actinoplanes lobatus]